MSDVLRIRRAAPGDLERSIELLAAAGLPTADLVLDRLALVAMVDDTITGLIGLERFGPRGLLRSLVIDPTYRRRGLGDRLVAALEHHAARMGIVELWLLTIDADPYFERLGYMRQPRSAAPADIASSNEFSSLCPHDAALMNKSLVP